MKQYDTLAKNGHSLLILKGDPVTLWKSLITRFDINAVYVNSDYEPYGTERDLQVADLLQRQSISFHLTKDQVVFEKDEIQKSDNTPYTVFTPYKNRWIQKINGNSLLLNSESGNKKHNFFIQNEHFPSIKELGFIQSPIKDHFLFLPDS